MIIYDIHPDNPQKRYLEDVSKKMSKGELSIYPTDLNYGLGASLNSAKGVKALNKLAEILKRSALHSLIFNNFSEISKFAYISNIQFKILKKHLPGPYTFVLEAKNTVPKLCQTKRKTIGVRFLNIPITNDLIDKLGSPLLNISAINDDNILSEIPNDIVQNYKSFNYITSFLSIGDILSSKTTVVDLTNDSDIEILR